MSTIVCSNVSMPVSDEAEQIARARAQADLVDWINTVCARYGLNLSELSMALGVYAPPQGQPGRALAARWKAGVRQPDAYHRSLLQLIAQGELELVEVGAEGRRKLFRVVPAARG